MHLALGPGLNRNLAACPSDQTVDAEEALYVADDVTRVRRSQSPHTDVVSFQVSVTTVSVTGLRFEYNCVLGRTWLVTSLL